ncbi:hypothetical protein HanPI659440_Chr08g0287081 [Helianthus annuus]|nr:hypothetical protein HanPI659440_Chr08g0287081 [Helianthus annuus]
MVQNRLDLSRVKLEFKTLKKKKKTHTHTHKLQIKNYTKNLINKTLIDNKLQLTL